jgi:PadR family transcriptional regulator AphA
MRVESDGKVVNKVSPTTYGLLGLLAVRSWTGYELTHQLRRSLRFVWSSSEGHLYREQKRLVEMGWATVENEPAGQRTRKRYTITPSGRIALSEWLASEPEEPHFDIEGVLRLFYADQGSTADLTASMEATARAAREMLGEMVDIVDEYLRDGGPLSMLEQGVGGPDRERLEYSGRPQYPERLHVIALVIDITTRLLAQLDEFFTTTAEETRTWTGTTQPQLTPATRRRLEAVSARHSKTRGSAPRRP